ncbi:hypothetical protein EGX47_04355 [Yersinia pseudotuberculosis]|uniref:HNH endonuclease n=1 Tax=Yersinia pseudotuberculosis TaxID=633 RepID=A0ABM7AEL3_YERPU|nr:hypothetical protein [Yersinia pseudotuberculosis]AYW90633.1 hypothetical protein EGX47_04355 [Yersinia pseudotuberculosis]
MDQLRSLADNRLVTGCIYCGGLEETRDHVPSKVFLDPPFPENLPIVGACEACNNGFSLDEEYLACLIESAIAGSANPDYIRRLKIADILRRSPQLQNRIDSSKHIRNGQTYFEVESKRIKNIILKLARGHAAFELSQRCYESPSSIWWYPIELLNDVQREPFKSCHIVEAFGEIGSRWLQRLIVLEIIILSPIGEKLKRNVLVNDWINVQDGCYRYLTVHDYEGVKIYMVIGEYLACRVMWTS